MKLKTRAAATCLSLAAASTANALTLALEDVSLTAGAEVVLTD